MSPCLPDAAGSPLWQRCTSSCQTATLELNWCRTARRRTNGAAVSRSTRCQDQPRVWLIGAMNQIFFFFFPVDHGSLLPSLADLLKEYYYRKNTKGNIIIRDCHLLVCGWMQMQNKVILWDYIYWYFMTRINPSLFVIIVSVWCNSASVCGLSSCPFQVASANRRPSETVSVSHLRLLLGLFFCSKPFCVVIKLNLCCTFAFCALYVAERGCIFY